MTLTDNFELDPKAMEKFRYSFFNDSLETAVKEYIKTDKRFADIMSGKSLVFQPTRLAKLMTKRINYVQRTASRMNLRARKNILYPELTKEVINDICKLPNDARV